jgi:pre-60S factor REI1
MLSIAGRLTLVFSRYNLKRRVASLPAISSEVFTEKVIQARAETTAQADKAGFERACDTCQKTYYSENSFRNHLSSAKHKARAAALASQTNGKIDDEASSMSFSLGEPAADSAVDSDAEEEFNEVVEGLKNAGLHDSTSPVKRPSNPHLSAEGQNKPEHPVSQTSSEEDPSAATPSAPTPTGAKPAPTAPSLNTCLFCSYESPTPPLNVAHMERAHGMFLPEKQYLVDLEGLVGYLQEQVFGLNECLTCGKVKANVFAVQTHMRDKSHCQIPYTTEDEQLDIGEFYDFRSTYSDDGDWEDEEEEQNGGAKLGAKRESKVTGENGDEVMEDETWETDSEASSADPNDPHAVRGDQPAHPHKRAHAVYHDEYELHLPSGKSVGHRSHNRYFRQNLFSYPTPEERAERLAIEEAEREYEMDVDRPASRGRDGAARGRALIGRDTRGLGVGALDDPRTRNLVTKGKNEEWKNNKSRRMLQTNLAIKERAPHPATYLR